MALFLCLQECEPILYKQFLGFRFSHSTKKGNLEVQTLLFKRFFSAKTIFFTKDLSSTIPED